MRIPRAFKTGAFKKKTLTQGIPSAKLITPPAFTATAYVMQIIHRPKYIHDSVAIHTLVGVSKFIPVDLNYLSLQFSTF